MEYIPLNQTEKSLCVDAFLRVVQKIESSHKTAEKV